MASGVPGCGWGLPTWASRRVGLGRVSPSLAGPGSLQCHGCQQRELQGAVSVLVHLTDAHRQDGGPEAGLGPT